MLIATELADIDVLDNSPSDPADRGANVNLKES